MTAIKPTAFRLPSKYLVFLEMLATEHKSDRSKELIKILDAEVARYLSRKPTISRHR